jgi:hypothetical protein
MTMPVMSIVHENRKQFGYDEAFYAFLDDMKSRCGVELLQRDFMIYEEDYFMDYTHVNYLGAQRVTKFIAEKLANARIAGAN